MRRISMVIGFPLISPCKVCTFLLHLGVCLCWARRGLLTPIVESDAGGLNGYVASILFPPLKDDIFPLCLIFSLCSVYCDGSAELTAPSGRNSSYGSGVMQ